jgi:hypothetical protein
MLPDYNRYFKVWEWGYDGNEYGGYDGNEDVYGL